MSPSSHPPDTPHTVTTDLQVIQQAERSPDAVAATAGEDRLTYRELEQASGRLAGILSLSDWKSAFKKGDNSLTAGDIATKKVITVTDRDSLLSALAKITSGDFAILPVVEQHRPDKIVGVISRTDIMLAFNNFIMKRR